MDFADKLILRNKIYVLERGINSHYKWKQGKSTR